MKTIEVTTEEEQVFLTWLQERETALVSQLQVLQTLRKKLSVVATTAVKSNAEPVNEADTSWVEKIEAVFKHHKQPVASGEIINVIMKQYPLLAEKGRKYVTKAVTSKLWVMQERGEVKKQVENGKNVYLYQK